MKRPDRRHPVSDSSPSVSGIRSPVPGIRYPVSRLHDAAFAILLAVLAGRCMIGELPFTSSQLQFVSHELFAGPAAAAGEPGASRAIRYAADRGEFARMTFAVAVFLAAALWAAGGALAGRLAVRFGPLAAIIAAFAVAAGASAWFASNRRCAVNAALEHTSLLLAAFLAAQLCRDRRRLALLAAVMLAIGAALAAKGLWQRTTEIPARIADFNAHRLDRLREFGWPDNTPQLGMVESRLRDTSLTGYLALANPFASLMLVLTLAGAGLALAKFRSARAHARQALLPRAAPADAAGRSSREVHPLFIAGAACAALALAALAVLLLARSRGALAGLAAAAVAFLAVLLFHRRLAARWRQAVLAVAVAFALAIGAVVAYGLANDRLPSRTMTFRWYYWTASADIVRAQPVLGVGGGNFATAYLLHRRAGAEEEVQSPHNFFADALAQYGLLGGGLFLAAVGFLLVGAARPCPRAAPHLDTAAPGTLSPSPGGYWMLIPAAVSVLLCRIFLSDVRVDPGLLVIDGIAPAAVFALALAAGAWGLRDLDDAAFGVLRAALACAAFGFFVNAMVAESPWIPAAATAFYLAAGAALAGRDPAAAEPAAEARPQAPALPVAAPLAFLLAILTIGMAAAVWLPVLNKIRSQEQMLAALQAGNVRAAASAAASAAAADKLDPLPAMDAAKLTAMTMFRHGGAQADALRGALDFAVQATQRDRRNFSCRLLLADLLWQYSEPDRAIWQGDGAAYARQAIELNPRDARLQLVVAKMFAQAAHEGKAAPALAKKLAPEVLRLAAEARRLDAALEPDSIVRLRPDELADLSHLENWARNETKE